MNYIMDKPLLMAEHRALFPGNKFRSIDKEYHEWKDFVGEAAERNRLEAEKRGMTLQEFKFKYPNEYMLPEEAFLKATLETNEGHSRGWALQYGEGFDREREALEKLKKALSFYEKIESTTPEAERWQLMKQAAEAASQFAPGILPSEYKKTILNFFKNHKAHYNRIYSYLYPIKYYNDYAKLLNVDKSLLSKVGELCSKPDLTKECLDMSVKNVTFDTI